MKKEIFFVILFIIGANIPQGFSQKNVRSFIFGHSLIHHEFQVNVTPSQETSVPHWFHFLAEEAGHDYAVGGQYGFLPQHVNLPPIAQWGFDFVDGAWDSDNEPFSNADFNNILITPGNFIQWQAPHENYPSESLSPLDATKTIFDWCIPQEDSLTFYVYENWPDMAPYLNNGFPPSNSEWNDFNDYLNDDFHNWFLEYHDSLIINYPNLCIKMIPVGPIISKLLFQEPFNQIPINSLYEDDAPHGRPTVYFLAALSTYMAMYEEKAPSSFLPPSIIHPTIIDNYQTVVDFIWDELVDFKDLNGSSRVFCNTPLQTSQNELFEKNEIQLVPNPSIGKIQIIGKQNQYILEITDYSNRVLNKIKINNASIIDLSHFPTGFYFVKIFNEKSDYITTEKIIKIN